VGSLPTKPDKRHYRPLKRRRLEYGSMWAACQQNQRIGRGDPLGDQQEKRRDNVNRGCRNLRSSIILINKRKRLDLLRDFRQGVRDTLGHSILPDQMQGHRQVSSLGSTGYGSPYRPHHGFGLHRL
jgi:hypothetical protein